MSALEGGQAGGGEAPRTATSSFILGRSHFTVRAIRRTTTPTDCENFHLTDCFRTIYTDVTAGIIRVNIPYNIVMILPDTLRKGFRNRCVQGFLVNPECNFCLFTPLGRIHQRG